MTAVLVFGDVPSTGHVARSGTERVSVGDHSGAVTPESVLDLVRLRLQEADHVMALYPSWRPEPVRHALQLARSSLATERVILAPSPLPPLALSLVADQLGYIAPYCPPGALAALLPTLGRAALSGAWVDSVAGLEHVPTSLAHHMGSYLPSRGFMVTASPSARVHRVTQSVPVDELAYRPAEPVHVIAGCGDGAPTAWIRERLLPEVRAQYVRYVSAPPLGEAYWGTKKHAEFVVFSGHPKALSVIANSVRCRPCPWCGEPVAESTCPLCSMVAPRQPEQPPVAPQAPAEPADQQPGADQPDDVRQLPGGGRTEGANRPQPGGDHGSVPADTRKGAL